METLSGLYAITDEQLLLGEQLFVKTEAALQGGCKLLQYRIGDASTLTRSQKQQQATRLRTLCSRYGCTFLINDDVDLAKKVKADGVHLGQNDMPLSEARKQLGSQAIIGITCHDSLKLARKAEEEGADYVAFGRFYASHTKPQAPLAKLNILAQARQQLSIPIVAIGGITQHNVTELIQFGAHMTAVIHDLWRENETEAIINKVRLYQQQFELYNS